MVSRERLQELLTYDRETGEFRARISINRRKAGTVAGSIHHTGYREIKIDGKTYRASHLAWLYVYGSWPLSQIDHRDLNAANDRIDNLREADHSQNGANKLAYKNNACGIKGVHRFKSHGRLTNRFRAQIKKSGRVIHLGLFDTAHEAAAAYQRAATSLHGVFARY